jgi:hypothetical protein
MKLLLASLLIFITNATSANVITHFEWGKVVVNSAGVEYTFKDCKLSPKGPQAWNWKEFGTQHVPGIQIQDLQSIIEDSDIIILSRGVDLMLQVKPETINYLKQLGKETHILQSEEAVKLYNKLTQQNKRVGILLHSTC